RASETWRRRSRRIRRGRLPQDGGRHGWRGRSPPTPWHGWEFSEGAAGAMGGAPAGVGPGHGRWARGGRQEAPAEVARVPRGWAGPPVFHLRPSAARARYGDRGRGPRRGGGTAHGALAAGGPRRLRLRRRWVVRYIRDVGLGEEKLLHPLEARPRPAPEGARGADPLRSGNGALVDPDGLGEEDPDAPANLLPVDLAFLGAELLRDRRGHHLLVEHLVEAADPFSGGGGPVAVAHLDRSEIIALGAEPP